MQTNEPPPLRLSQASGVPFYRQLADQLADRIRAGQLGAGEALPSVRQLAADVLVSVITVKQAYQVLENAGLVYSQQGRGTFVAEGAAGAARAELHAEIAGALDAAVARAATLGVPKASLEISFTTSIQRHFPTQRS